MSHPQHLSSHLSTLRLHQLRLGELSREEEHDARAHLSACPRCEGRFGQQASARAAFLATPVPAALLPQPSLPPLSERVRAWLSIPRLGLLALPAFIVLFSVLSPPSLFPETGISESGEREKGGIPTLEAWVQTGDSVRPLYSGEKVGAGTTLQLRFNPRGHRFVTLAGRDGRGTVEVYGTVSGGTGLKTAPFALTLDDASGKQAFFAVLTDTRPDPDDLLETLKKDPVKLEKAEVTTLVLEKE